MIKYKNSFAKQLIVFGFITLETQMIRTIIMNIDFFSLAKIEF